jgi:hypothetical protein
MQMFSISMYVSAINPGYNLVPDIGSIAALF